MSKIDLAAKTKAELLKVAQRLGLRGISTMNKDKLVAAVNRAQQRTTAPRRQPQLPVPSRLDHPRGKHRRHPPPGRRAIERSAG